MKNKQVLLASRPRGPVEEADFRLVEAEVPPVLDGQVLTRVHYLSLDPYMRGRMEEAKSYAAPQPLGAVMIGGTVAEVVESKNPAFKPGDLVVGMAGWQQYQVTDGTGLRKIVALGPSTKRPILARLIATGFSACAKPWSRASSAAGSSDS